MKNRPRLLLVDDDDVFRHVMASELDRLGFDVNPVGSGEEALAKMERLQPEVVLLDIQLPGMTGIETLKAMRQAGASAEVIMLTGHGSIDSAIESIRAGAFDYVAKPCPLEELQIRIQRGLERRALEQRATLLERGLTPPDLGSAFVGESQEFRSMLGQIERVAATGSSVLLLGETGVGKEMVAKLIHARGPRRSRPFVVVECSALQESLLESELFGHERGAFTGADRAKPGLFEVAHTGTIFLDEIGEVSQATQVKLLRVLDTSTFRHVGGTAEIRVDVRVLAATNRDLPALVGQGLFREDLYYRLATITLRIPPLRERPDDVVILAEHFCRVFNERFGFRKRIAPETLAALRQHPWPGNVREFLHVVEAAMVLCEGQEVRPEHLPATVRPASPASVPSAAAVGRVPTLEELERRHIVSVLEATRGHRGQAAQILGISERNLYRKLREYGLPS